MNIETKFSIHLDNILWPTESHKTSSKADNIVFEIDKDWVIIDVPELHEYVKKQSVKIVQFEDLLVKLEWNIVLPKK